MQSPRPHGGRAREGEQPATARLIGLDLAITWVPFVIAGMAVARLDLAGTAARMRLAGTGATLAVAGYGGSWLALRLVPGAADDAIQLLKGGSSVSSGPPSPPPGSRMYGDSPFGLLAASPHSETTLSIVATPAWRSWW